ncbi:hypothetical protein Q3G72_010566 [Acer saccharum]|nr:hypothetical protein Q3G72_010566 [Acer saccharum]
MKLNHNSGALNFDGYGEYRRVPDDLSYGYGVDIDGVAFDLQTIVYGEERLLEKNWLCRLFNLLMRPLKKNGDVNEVQEQKSWSWNLVNRTTDEKKNNTPVVVPGVV